MNTRETVTRETVVRSTCELCNEGCGVLVHLSDGKPVKVVGDPENPINSGAICSKGRSSIDILNHPDRLKYPLKRKGRRGEGNWQQITWNEALNTIAGEADMIVACPFPMVGELESSGYGIIKVPTHPTPQIMFHTRNPKTPWHHKKVRLAIAHAIDTDAISNKLFHGIPGHYARIAPWELGYDPMLKPYTYDPTKAKRLLAEAGYPNGFDMPLYYMVGRIANQKETVEVVSLYLKAVGINVKVQGLETVKVIKLVKGEWHPKADVEVVVLFALPTAHWADPTQALIIAFSSKSWGSLYFRPDLDVLINEARTTLDDEKRGSLIRKAFQIIHDDVGSIVIWANMTVFVTQKNIAFKPTRKQPYPLVHVKNITFQ